MDNGYKNKSDYQKENFFFTSQKLDNIFVIEPPKNKRKTNKFSIIQKIIIKEKIKLKVDIIESMIRKLELGKKKNL